MTSGTVNIGLCPTPDETRMTVPMLRAVLYGARRLRRFGPQLARIAAGGDEPSGPRRIAALDAQGASDRDDRPEGRSLLAAYRLSAACGYGCTDARLGCSRCMTALGSSAHRDGASRWQRRVVRIASETPRTWPCRSRRFGACPGSSRAWRRVRRACWPAAGRRGARRDDAPVAAGPGLSVESWPWASPPGWQAPAQDSSPEVFPWGEGGAVGPHREAGRRRSAAWGRGRTKKAAIGRFFQSVTAITSCGR